MNKYTLKAFYRPAKKVALCLALILIQKNVAIANDTSVALYTSQVIRQDAEKMDCGPAAIFNSFALGNANLQTAIKNLEGTTAQGKYEFMLNELTQKQSVHFSKENLPRTQRNLGGGTFVGDMDAILEDMTQLTQSADIKKFSGGFSYRQKGEKQGDLLLRIHADITHSLEAGYPPIMSRAYYGAGMRRYGHYTVIYSVSAIQNIQGQNAFKIKVYDSIPAVSQEWLVTESSDYFEAYSWELNRSGMKLIAPEDSTGSRMSPYLKIFPEDFQASRTYEGRLVQQEPDSYLIMETLFGLFNDPKLYVLGDKKKK